MNKTKVIYFQLLFCILFVLITVLFAPNASAHLWQGLQRSNSYDDNWTVNAPSMSTHYDSLPTFCYLDDGGSDIWLSKELSNVQMQDSIGFFSFQQQVEIFLDGETVYRFVPTSYARSKTPGNKWNFLPLDETANGKTLTIHIYQCYGPGRVTVPDFYYGSQSGIMLNYLAKELPRTYFSLAMVFVGCLLCIFHTLKRNSTLVGDSLKWLALFAIFRGTWSYIEFNTYSLYAPQRLFLVKFTEAL